LYGTSHLNAYEKVGDRGAFGKRFCEFLAKNIEFQCFVLHVVEPGQTGDLVLGQVTEQLRHRKKDCRHETEFELFHIFEFARSKWLKFQSPFRANIGALRENHRMVIEKIVVYMIMSIISGFCRSVQLFAVPCMEV
jgi:hypothetical protein